MQISSNHPSTGFAANWLEQGLSVLFPPVCAICRRVCLPGQIGLACGGGRICRACLATLPLRTGEKRSLDWPVQLADPSHRGARVLCAGYYRDTLRQALVRIKFADSPETAAALSGLLVQLAAGRDVRFDAVMAVPLHRDRLRERGYNQAGLLAKQVSLAMRLPDWSEHLTRNRATGRQSAQQNREERLANLAGAFSLCDGFRLGRTAANPPHILLLDDILTTGATLTAAATALWQAGFQVTGLVVASNRQH